MKLNNKTLIYASVGVAVLVIGFLAYKKFGKKNETDGQEKKGDVEEEVIEETETTKSEVAPKNNITSSKNIKSSPIVPSKNIESSKPKSDDLFKKFGITEADYKKMKTKDRELRKKHNYTTSASKLPYIKEIREFAEKNAISYGAYKKADEFKLQERSKKVVVGEMPMSEFAGFMDFDGFPDVQGNIM